MKKKETLEIPDSVFTAFGICTPNQECERAEEYETGNSITEFLKAERVLTLKKESRYQKVLPKFERLDLLKLNLKDIPKNKYQKTEYLMQAIKKRVTRVFAPMRHGEDAETAKANIQALTKCYEKDLSIEPATENDSKEASIASAVFCQEHFYLVKLRQLEQPKTYGSFFGKRSKKEGYYALRMDKSLKIHVLNLVDFLAFLSLLQEIHDIQHEVDLPLVQCYFEEYIQGEQSQPNLPFDRKLAVDAIAARRPIPLDVLVHACQTKDRERVFISMRADLQCVLADLFIKIHSLYQDISYEVKGRAEHAKTIATAYITKKNIPGPIRQAMGESSFMDYFRFVEFDEDVDLSSVRNIEREFLVLNRAYFHDLKYPTVDLRFRKLGKHRATGLYYPSMDTLCVDIRSPASFIHEFYHMLDDQLGDLSLSTDFEPLVEEYKRAFEEGLADQSDQTKKSLNGNTKYNKAYFFRRAEIFARCGEIYFTRILKVESSLVNPSLPFAYPPSEKLDKLIKAYYENLLEKRPKENVLSATV